MSSAQKNDASRRRATTTRSMSADDLGGGLVVAVDDGREARHGAALEPGERTSGDGRGRSRAPRWATPELGGHAARHDGRVLDEVGPFGREAVVVEGGASGGRLEASFDPLLAVARAEHDRRPARRASRSAKVFTGEGLPAAPAGQEAMAEGDVAALDRDRPRPRRPPSGGSRRERPRRRAGRRSSGSAGQTGRHPCRRRARRPSSCASERRDPAAGRARREGTTSAEGRPSIFLRNSRWSSSGLAASFGPCSRSSGRAPTFFGESLGGARPVTGGVAGRLQGRAPDRSPRGRPACGHDGTAHEPPRASRAPGPRPDRGSPWSAAPRACARAAR